MKKFLLILPLFLTTPAMAKSHSITHHVVKIAKKSIPVAVGVVAGEWAYHRFVETPPAPPVIQEAPQEDEDYYPRRHYHEDDDEDDRDEHMSYRDKINSGYTGP